MATISLNLWSGKKADNPSAYKVPVDEEVLADVALMQIQAEYDGKYDLDAAARGVKKLQTRTSSMTFSLLYSPESRGYFITRVFDHFGGIEDKRVRQAVLRAKIENDQKDFHQLKSYRAITDKFLLTRIRPVCAFFNEGETRLSSDLIKNSMKLHAMTRS